MPIRKIDDCNRVVSNHDQDVKVFKDLLQPHGLSPYTLPFLLDRGSQLDVSHYSNKWCHFHCKI